MATITPSYWYDSSNDEYEIPVVYLGVLDNYPNVTNETNPSVSDVSLFSGWSGSFSFKGAITGTFPAIVAPANEIVRALGRYGTFYPSSDSISSDNYFRVSQISADRVSYYACATDSENVSNVDSAYTGATAYCLGLGTIGGNVYLGIYGYGTGLGGDEHSGWLFAYNTENYQPWNVLKSILTIDPVPGQKNFKPTGTRYKRTKPGIGGRGHGATHKGQTPAYGTTVITNPSRPDESVASVVGAGLITTYQIGKSALGELAGCLYGTTLLGLVTNLAINPLDFIVSLNIFPCEPDTLASAHVTLGNWVCTDSGTGLGANVTGRPLQHQFKTISFGSINVYENWGNFLDYSNTKMELYLPFIGFVDVDVAEVMDGSITLDYTIDFLTGMCVANVNCNKFVETPDGEIYQQSSQHAYQGNCAISVPLGQMQYGQIVGSLISAGVSGMRGGIASAGMSLASDFVSGNLTPNGSTKGSISANAGFCSVLYPYIRITRPISCESDSYQEVMGYPSYIDSTLGACEDLCICESIDLHTISGATDSEIERIRQMCLEGVHV